MTSFTRSDRATHLGALARPGVVVAGVLVALAVWGAADVAVDHLREPAFGTAPPRDLGPGMVAGASMVGGLIGWAALAVAERLFARGRTLWLWAVSVALLLSLRGPLSGEGVSAGNRVALVVLHLAVALVVIPLLYRTSPPARNSRSEDH